MNYEIIRNNNLDGYQELSLKNIEKLDYSLEKDNQYKKSKEIEINNLKEDGDDLSFLELESLVDIDNNIDLEEITFRNLDELNNHNMEENIDNISLDSEIDLMVKKRKLSSDSLNSEDDMSICSDSSFSSLSSQGSCIFAEIFLKIKNFPVQVLAMERLDITLTEMVKKNMLNLEDWRSYLFELCFGLAVAQKNYGFIHNDLHSDNIMFKSTKIDYKYYQFRDIYFKVPTHNRETKVIDFARGIIKVGKKTYFSDVFKNDGDAGGQYNYLNKQKVKKFNFHFDLARLATTIHEFTQHNSELVEINKLLILWTESKTGDSFLEMEDNFSLYVSIAENACNALPREQLQQEIFKKYIIESKDIPIGSHIYKY